MYASPAGPVYFACEEARSVRSIRSIRTAAAHTAPGQRWEVRRGSTAQGKQKPIRKSPFERRESNAGRLEYPGTVVDPEAAQMPPLGKARPSSQSSGSATQEAPGSSKGWAEATGAESVPGTHKSGCRSRSGRSSKTRHPRSNRWTRRIGQVAERDAPRQDWDLAA